jgi:Mg2+ and Co2+ transporter CorA
VAHGSDDSTAHALAVIERIETRILAIEVVILNLERNIMSALDDLAAEVAEVQTVEASAIALIQGLVAQLETALNDPAKIATITAQLKAATEPLAAAVAANTAPPPAP